MRLLDEVPEKSGSQLSKNEPESREVPGVANVINKRLEHAKVGSVLPSLGAPPGSQHF